MHKIAITLFVVASFAARIGCSQYSEPQQQMLEPKIESLVDAMVNQNDKPKVVMVGRRKELLFAPEYRWEEHDRLLGYFRALNDDPRTGKIWKELKKHFGDNRYVFYLDDDPNPGSFECLTIGRLCQDIVEGDALFPYMQFATPIPDVLGREGREFELWLPKIEQRLDILDAKLSSELWAVQLQFAKWAISEAPALGELREPKLCEFREKVQQAIDQLERTHQPIVSAKRFTAKMSSHYTRQRADRVRLQIQDAGK